MTNTKTAAAKLLAKTIIKIEKLDPALAARLSDALAAEFAKK
jgi:hypothetical protein